MSQPPSENAPAAPTDEHRTDGAPVDDARAATILSAAGPAEPQAPGATSDGEPSKEPTSLPRQRSALALAAMAGVAVPGLDAAKLALPQEESPELHVVGVIDTKGRHWEVLEARDDATGAALEAEAEVLKRIGRVVDDGYLSFNVPRPAGSLRRKDAHVQVRTHLEGHPIDVSALRPGPGLSAGLGKALGELHELSTDIVADSGMPVYDAAETRQRWESLLDEARTTGKVPDLLLDRWEAALSDASLWRFKPVLVHGDLAEENVLTSGGAVTAIRGLGLTHVGDPAEDLAWVYSSVPVDCLDSIEAAYEAARAEGTDKHLRERAELVSELSLVRWLLHGVRAENEGITADAVAMLDDLASQVGSETITGEAAPHLAAVDPLPEHLDDDAEHEPADADDVSAEATTSPQDSEETTTEGDDTVVRLAARQRPHRD